MNLGSLTSSNKLLYILVGSIALLIFLTIIMIIRSTGGASTAPVKLEFWGVFDEPSTFDAAIRAYENQHSNVKISYRNFSYDQYEESVIQALAAGTGPDIWMIENTWLAKHGDKLAPLPDKIAGEKLPLMTIKDFQDQFVDVAFKDLVMNGKIYSLPLYIDTLALYYNKDLLNTAGITRPPATWDEFNNDMTRLTQLDASRNIVRSGAAIGTSRNINRSTDILMSLMLQSGVQMTNSDNTNATFSRSVDNQRLGEIALQYYTDFTNKSKLVYCWDDTQHYSIDAFAEENTAMMFNYSYQIPFLRSKATRLNFDVAPMPQLSLDNIRTYANYWSPAVSLSSKNIGPAWQFIAYLASADGARSYLDATNRPAARRDLIELQKTDPDIGVYATQALSARSWYQVDSVAIEKIFADMIDDVNLNRLNYKDAIQKAESKVSVLMSH